MAHSDVDLDVDGLDKVKDKNEHAVTVKIKREPWVAETRVYDAVDSEKEIRRIVEFNRKFLEKLI